MTVTLPYALVNNQLVHVDSVQNGQSCGAICPECGESLVARHGRMRQHGFAHRSASDCKSSTESLAHRLAKIILARAGYIRVPSLFVPTGWGIQLQKVVEEQQLSVSHVRLEHWCDGIRPDLIVTVSGQDHQRDLFVEIKVSHGASREKLEWLAKRRQPAIEIPVSREVLNKSFEAFEAEVLRARHAKWLFHPAEADAPRMGQFDDELEARRKQRGRYPLPPEGKFLARSSPKLTALVMETADAFHEEHGRWPRWSELPQSLLAEVEVARFADGERRERAKRKCSTTPAEPAALPRSECEPHPELDPRGEWLMIKRAEWLQRHPDLHAFYRQFTREHLHQPTRADYPPQLEHLYRDFMR